MDVDHLEGISSIDQRIETVVKSAGLAERNSTSALLNVRVTDPNGQTYVLLMARKRGADSDKPTMSQIGGSASVPEDYLDTILSRIQPANPTDHVTYKKQEVKDGMADLRVSGFTDIRAQIHYEQLVAQIMRTETAPNIIREIDEELANGDQNEWETLVKRLRVHGVHGQDNPPEALRETLVTACLTAKNPPVIRPAETNRISTRSGKEEKTHSLLCEMTVEIPMDQIAKSIEENYIQVIDNETTVIASPFVLIPVEIAHELSQVSPDDEDEITSPYVIGESKTPVRFTSNALKAA